MIEFNPSKLLIQNFRGVPNFELNFQAKEPVYVIGPNNAGKSTILNAIALLFKSGGFHTFKPAKYDFFIDSKNSMAESFNIRMQFLSNDRLPSVHTVGKVHEVHAIEVEGKFYKTSERFDHSHRLLDSGGTTITVPTEVPLSKKDASTYSDAGHGYKLRNANLNDIRDYLPELWLLNSQNLNASLYIWKTGPLNKLAKILSQKFFEEKWDFQYEGKKSKMPQGISNAHEYFSTAVREFPFWKDTMKPKLEKSLSIFIGRQSSISLNPLIQNVEQWLQQQLMLSFASEMGHAITPLNRMGDGYQSLVRLAALEVLAELDEVKTDKVFILYEEPETYLHPHLKRKMRNIFDMLSAKGWYIVCATHSPEFISFEKSQNINRIIREPDKLIQGVVITNNLPDNLKLQEKIDEYGNHEIFFAQKVVLCEGKDDLFALKTYLEKSEIDLDARSISILSCSSNGNIPDFAQISKNLVIPFCAVTDLDKQNGGTVKKNTKEAREKINQIKTDKDLMVEWDNTLEDCLETPLNNNERQKATVEWQRDNIADKDLKCLKSKYPKYVHVCETIKKWLEKN